MDGDNVRPPGPDADHGITISVSIPASDGSLYRYRATDRVPHVLADSPYAAFTIRELGRLTGHAHSTIADVVDVLEPNGIVDVEAAGNRKRVSINRSRLSKPTDPVLQIPQPQFHAPVRTAVSRLRDELDDVEGIIAFGSVARGEADRQSDVDLWVLVRSDRGTNQRRANEIGTELGGQRFDGDRYEFQILVESARSALHVDDRLEEVIATGVTLYETETLRLFEREVLADG